MTEVSKLLLSADFLMLSLYLHFPFCAQVCSYCSFSIVANQSSDMIAAYLTKLHQEIDFYARHYPQAEIKSIYLGGGTPSLMGITEMKKLIDHLMEVFDCEHLAELSIEANPFPEQEILNLVKELNQYYKKIARLRFSFGIQSFDNGVLQQVNRPYTFPGMVEFLRNLQPLKQENNIFNLDFIAFGHWNTTKKGNRQLWTESALSFFSSLANAHFADSFSLYTLEFSEHQARNRNKLAFQQKGAFGTEDEIYEEFDVLKNILLDAGYSRYEISNFALKAKSSIHNRVYREMEEYLGLGLGAAGLMQQKGKEKEKTDATITQRIRTQNTPYLPKYLARTFESDESEGREQIPLTSKDVLIEKCFLALRTDRGISNLAEFATLWVSEYHSKIQQMQEQGLLLATNTTLKLTEKGMDYYNRIITELLAEI